MCVQKTLCFSSAPHTGRCGDVVCGDPYPSGVPCDLTQPPHCLPGIRADATGYRLGPTRLSPLQVPVPSPKLSPVLLTYQL